jgi:hypothetical protein
MYSDMWQTQYAELLRVFPEKDVLFLRYEDLVDDRRKYSALRLLIEFLGFPPASSERLACAFALTESHKVSPSSISVTWHLLTL